LNADPRLNERGEAATPQTDSVAKTTPGLLRSAFEGLQIHVDKLNALEEVVDQLADAGGETAQATTRKLKRQIREFEPTVTMIGQVKAGKTTLVNALVGWPDLLPADINPWTSVITSLHLDPIAHQTAARARFSFFNEEEWNRLLSRGGRVGELAARAGAHKELEKVRQQMTEMREKSRQRLGRKFELLMGQEHEYGYFDEELIQRYVCLGDDPDGDEDGPSLQQGRFADITKSADLFLRQPEIPGRLCIRDTPGVNDTFMIREQITVNAIRESRLCVVVLSAHQTLSTVDMALIRLISNINSRDVIIFVNRIDELGNPVDETEEIRESIVRTLKAQNGPMDAEIIFGSAHWASHALSGKVEELGEASAEAVVRWAERHMTEDLAASSVEETIWELSGVPELARAISGRVSEGEGAEFADRLARSARNLANGLAATRKVMSRRLDGGPVKPVQRKDIGRELDGIAARNTENLQEQLGDLITDLDGRLAGSRKSFLQRATASLIKHLEAYGENEVWNYDPSGLRLLLRSGYRVFATKSVRASEDVFSKTTSEIRDLYIAAFQIPDAAISLEPPTVPKPPAPVILGSSIALDIKGNWWNNWWRRRRSYKAFAEEFSELIDAEVEPFVTSLRADHAETYLEAVEQALSEFVETQRAHLLDLADKTDVGIDQLRDTLGRTGMARWDTLRSTLEKLSELDQTRKGGTRHDPRSTG
jgi:signal recognition particle receptor subunit beta